MLNIYSINRNENDILVKKLKHMSIKYINLYYQFLKKNIQKCTRGISCYLSTKERKGKDKKKERKAKREKGKWGE